MHARCPRPRDYTYRLDSQWLESCGHAAAAAAVPLTCACASHLCAALRKGSDLELDEFEEPEAGGSTGGSSPAGGSGGGDRGGEGRSGGGSGTASGGSGGGAAAAGGRAATAASSSGTGAGAVAPAAAVAAAAGTAHVEAAGALTPPPPGVLRPGIVHRLDKGTSGLMVVAKDDLSHARLCDQFKARTVRAGGRLRAGAALGCVCWGACPGPRSSWRQLTWPGGPNRCGAARRWGGGRLAAPVAPCPDKPPSQETPG